MEKGRELEILARENFAVWNQALLSLDSRKVAELYADDASFLPTLNPELKRAKKGWSSISNIFWKNIQKARLWKGLFRKFPPMKTAMFPLFCIPACIILQLESRTIAR